MESCLNKIPKPRTILMVNTNFGTIGGVERYLLQISTLLKKDGWKVFGLFEQQAGNIDGWDDVFEQRDFCSHSNIKSIIKKYLDLNLDFVFFHKFSNPIATSRLQAEFFSICLVHDHDYYCLRKHKYFPYKRLNCVLPFTVIGCSVCSGLLTKKNGKLCLINIHQSYSVLQQMRRCDATIVLSEYMRKNVIQNGWQASKTHKLYPIVSLSKSSVIPHSEDYIPTILYCGQLIRGKGVDLLLLALVKLPIPYKCIIVGTGNDEFWLKKMADELNLTANIEWVGWTTEVDTYYAQADVLAVPSRWQEPFGLIGIEAFSHKLPVVAFDVGGISEWLHHKVNGLLVRGNDTGAFAKALTRILADKLQSVRFGQSGYQLIQDQYNETQFLTGFNQICQNKYEVNMEASSDSVILSKLNILDIKFVNETMETALSLIDCRIAERKKTCFFFLNADCYNKIFIDKEYKHILTANDVNFPDGSGIKLGAKLLGKQVLENVNGTDMLPLLCERSVRNKYRIFLLGAAPGVADMMKDNLEQQYPGLEICGTRNGYFDWETESNEVITSINETKADILLVGFGAPLQEKWIKKNFDALNPFILMGVGGLFDFYSGRIPRAPLWMRKCGIEWTYRLIQEPRRMWKRYILGNPLFVYRVWRWKQKLS